MEREDPETVTNPQEPIRIEERVRSEKDSTNLLGIILNFKSFHRKKKKKKRRKRRKTSISHREVSTKEVKSKVGSIEKTHKLENVPKRAPKPYRKEQLSAEKLILDIREYF